MKRSMMAIALGLTLVALSGCANKQEQMHSEGRVDSTRIMYTCSSLAQKQLAIQQFNACYMMAPKTKTNRQACEETARSLACDRYVEEGGKTVSF